MIVMPFFFGGPPLLWRRFFLLIALSGIAPYTVVGAFSLDSARIFQSSSYAENLVGTEHHRYQALLESIQTFFDMTDDDRSDCQRIFHGRGNNFPGLEHLTLDWYPPVFLFSSFRDSDKSRREVQLVLYTLECERKRRIRQSSTSMKNGVSDIEMVPPINLVYQNRDGIVLTELIAGSVPDHPHIVEEIGNKYIVNLLKSKNHGLFLDMRNGRKWVQDHAEGKLVLNLFSYTCAFSVAALSGGADEVINMDMAKGPLKQGQRNHEINFDFGSTANNTTNEKQEGSARFLAHNIFKSWGKLKRLGPYDIIIADPPSYQKGSFVVKKDYGKIIRRIPSLLKPGGHALLCLNAPELDTTWLRDLVQIEAPGLDFVQRIDNPDSFPVLDEEKALKVMLFQLPTDYVVTAEE